MNKRKLISSIIVSLGIAILITCFGQTPSNVKAADVIYESENNNNKFEANNLTVNTPTIGCMQSQDDIDYYKYVVDKTGYFTVSFENICGSVDVGYGWNFHIYDESLNELYGENGITTSITSYTYNFDIGTVFYVMVEPRYNDDDVDNKNYALTVNFVSDSSWETEANNTKNFATELISNEKKFGTMYIGSDVDYYKYKVDVTGYYNFVFENESGTTDSGYGWNMSVYDSSLNELEVLNGITTKITSKTYNFKKGTTLYIKIESRYASNDVCNIKYSLTPAAKNSSKWEQEKNNSYTAATTLKNNSLKYGTIYISNDKDYYKYKSTKDAKIKLTFDFDSDNVGYGWDIKIYGSSKNLITNIDAVTTMKTVTWNAKKNKTYYIVITSRYSSTDAVDVQYSLKVKQ